MVGLSLIYCGDTLPLPSWSQTEPGWALEGPLASQRQGGRAEWRQKTVFGDCEQFAVSFMVDLTHRGPLQLSGIWLM